MAIPKLDPRTHPKEEILKSNSWFYNLTHEKILIIVFAIAILVILTILLLTCYKYKILLTKHRILKAYQSNPNTNSTSLTDSEQKTPLSPGTVAFNAKITSQNAQNPATSSSNSSSTPNRMMQIPRDQYDHSPYCPKKKSIEHKQSNASSNFSDRLKQSNSDLEGIDAFKVSNKTFRTPMPSKHSDLDSMGRKISSESGLSKNIFKHDSDDLGLPNSCVSPIFGGWSNSSDLLVILARFNTDS